MKALACALPPCAAFYACQRDDELAPAWFICIALVCLFAATRKPLSRSA